MAVAHGWIVGGVLLLLRQLQLLARTVDMPQAWRCVACSTTTLVSAKCPAPPQEPAASVACFTPVLLMHATRMQRMQGAMVCCADQVATDNQESHTRCTMQGTQVRGTNACSCSNATGGNPTSGSG
jgi:hypothetical protein